MSFIGLLQHQITTYRRSAGVGIQRTWQTNLSEQSCFIQPVSAEFAVKTGNVFGRTYNLFTDTAVDIQVGDKVIDQSNKEYRVSGSLNRNYGRNPHLTFIMTEETGGANPDV